MAYPDTIVKKGFRRAFLFFLIAIFIITTPTLILYSMGYRIDWESRKIIETGVISIDVKPKDVEVYLNNILITKKIPIRLTNRTPGSYELKISKPGYKTWEKTIDIKSKQTTYIKDINLLKDSLPVTVISDKQKNIAKIIPSTDGRYLILISIDNGVRLTELFDTQSTNLHLLSRVSQKMEQIIEWSPFNNYLLITTADAGSVSVSLLSAETPENLKTYRLNKDGYGYIFQWQKDSLIPTLFTRNLNKIIRLAANGSENIFNVEPDDIWYIDSQEKLWLYQENKIMLAHSSNDTNSLNTPTNEKITAIIDINNERIVAKAKDKIIVLSRRQDKTEVLNVSSLTLNPATREWLAWSALELWSIYQHDKPAILNRTSDNIMSAFPLDDVGALLIANNKGLTAFNPGYYVSQNLFSGEVIGISVNQRIKKIYFLGKVAEIAGLFELEY